MVCVNQNLNELFKIFLESEEWPKMRLLVDKKFGLQLIVISWQPLLVNSTSVARGSEILAKNQLNELCHHLPRERERERGPTKSMPDLDRQIDFA